MRQSIQTIVERRHGLENLAKGARRDAEAGRNADTRDSRQLGQMRALAAGNRDLRMAELLEIQHATTHSLTPLHIF